MSRAWKTFAVGVANLLYFLLGLWLVYHQKVWTDEGWYYNGAVLFSKGLHPYVDFLYHRLPLNVELYGTLFKLFGASFATGRLVSLAFFMLLINAAAWVAHRITGGFTGALLAYAAFFSFPGFWGYLTVTTYSLSALLFVLSLVCILKNDWRLELRLALFMALNMLIWANRYIVDYHMVLLVMLTAGLAWHFRKNKLVLAAVLLPVVVGLLYIFKYTIFMGDTNIFFDTIDFNFKVQGEFAAALHLKPPSTTADMVKQFFSLRLEEIRAFYVIWIFGFAGIAMIAWSAVRKWRSIADFAPQKLALAYAALVALMNIGFYYISLDAVSVTKLYVYPFLVIISVWLAIHIFSALPSPNLRYAAYGVTGFLFLSNGLLAGEQKFNINYVDTDIAALKRVVAVIRQHAPKENTTLLTFTPQLADSGLTVEPRLNMELFTFKPNLPHDMVEKRMMMDMPLLEQAIVSGKYGVIALSGERFYKEAEWGMIKTIIPTRPRIIELIDRYYTEVAVVETPRFLGYHRIFVRTR